MPHVAVVMGGKTYRLACDEGQEGHLHRLAALVDGKLQELQGQFGEIGPERLSVMAALMMADQLTEAQTLVSSLKEELAQAQSLAEQAVDMEVRLQTAYKAVEGVTQRMEALGLRLNG
jgi:cell division protein ZapA